MERNNNSKLSIYIVTGFLGSGKTSFLKHYTEELLKRDEKIAVIMNEFGDFDVDSQILKPVIQTISLQNGCVCCDLSQALVAQLSVIINQNQAQHVIIEATGIAHPLQLIEACFDPVLANHVNPPQVIGLVDAPRFLQRHEYSDSTQQLMEEQIEVSNDIIVNKIDLINDEEQNEVKLQLKVLNPHGILLPATYGQVDFTDLKQKDSSDKPHSHSHLHHHGISSLAYTFTAPIDRQMFYQFILRLPENIYRLKGYVRFRDTPETTYLFQFAYGMPDYEPIQGNNTNAVVLIGENLDKERLRNQLDALQFT
ncbi:cobalamin biosynthesis protein CobW [Staphylococcus carnosus]|uniref:CobW family GTP-binding protein n=1 Tax=Staphylococcus carnosus TaxID=1281 RepID=UPI0006ABBE11|nr:GTP-binding protein [Staphylococcus carnosus]KOR14220.1 cobalamin biosynthesis protein CobW [Staphylococcus carnosus]